MERATLGVSSPRRRSGLDAFEGQIVELLPRLRRFGRALAGNVADADDLVQTAIERGLARRDQWQAGTSLEAWMFRIIKNAWIDQARFRVRRQRLFAPEEAGQLVADPAAGSAEARDLSLSVRAAMNDLPDDQRLAVVLILIEGLSYQEAADVLETPVGTVTSRLGRGRAALQARLAAVEG